ncbi:hypothetical protein BgiBS90_007826, partial [Biomphalaria glabrata]
WSPSVSGDPMERTVWLLRFKLKSPPRTEGNKMSMSGDWNQRSSLPSFHEKPATARPATSRHVCRGGGGVVVVFM